ncbi:DUF4345 domain-containing protein [Stutzerimonas nosocomialis]|uniref:DUF4345 domain-containing protein n=1 Tax=Stutzerimonas nosocomialis TaxID=1056496 RepID=UPI001107FCB9|nr:DUF4345 domain-containing protein [Stutzerimonas nosocomialis]TLX53801.1 DUF4345 domain-containing protein [Stutzerimonas nosocomialis]
MRFARIVLVAQAVVMVALSLAYWVRPYEMANLNGMLLMESASVSHMRVYYGGLQLGLALFLLWAVRAPDYARAALVMLVITLLTLAGARLASLWLDGGSLIGFDLVSLVYRLLGAALAAAALRSLRPEVEPQAPESAPTSRRHAFPREPAPFRVGEGPTPGDAVVTPAEPQPFRVGDPSPSDADPATPATPATPANPPAAGER